MKIIYLNHFNDIDMMNKDINDYAIHMEKPLNYNSKIALVYFEDDENFIEIDNFEYVLDISIITTDFVPYLNFDNKEISNQQKNFKEIFYYGLMDSYLPDEMLGWTVEEIINTCVNFDHIKDYNMHAIDKIDWSIAAHLRWYSFEDNRLQISLDKGENSHPILELKEIIDNNNKLVVSHGYKSMDLLYQLVMFNLQKNRAYTNTEIKDLLGHITITDNQA